MSAVSQNSRPPPPKNIRFTIHAICPHPFRIYIYRKDEISHLCRIIIWNVCFRDGGIYTPHTVQPARGSLKPNNQHFYFISFSIQNVYEISKIKKKKPKLHWKGGDDDDIMEFLNVLCICGKKNFYTDPLFRNERSVRTTMTMVVLGWLESECLDRNMFA